jgi:hypothetical protein
MESFASGYTTSSDGLSTDLSQIMALNLDTGTPIWSYEVPALNKLSLIAATAGNGLVAKTTSGSDAVVRFDLSGVATSDTWTTAGYRMVDFLAADAFVGTSTGFNQLAMISSGLDVDWALYSPWARPQPDGRADPKVNVTLTVSNIYVNTPEDIWNNSTVATEVNDVRDFWWKKGKIKLNWNGAIQAVKACDPILYPNGCGANPKEELSSITSQEAATEFGRRFCASGLHFTCTQKGSQLVFLSNIFLWGGLSGTADGWTPNTADTTNFLNISAIATIEAHNDIAHETGHQFQLEHEPWARPSNLMCANVWCPRYPGDYLSADQITTATKNAKLLE